MINLSNGCNCSELTVTPKDWKTCKVSAMARNWHIQYYFYDNALKKRKFVLVKGMNRLKTLNERRQATTQLIENELYQLREKGYNPITGKFFIEITSGIDHRTSFIDALWKAYRLLKLEAMTLVDVRSLIRFIEIAAKKAGIERMEIQDVKRRHLRQMLEMIGEYKKSWSAYSFNNARAYLMMLYKKLLEQDAVETNPVKDIPKEKIILRIKSVLTTEERLRVDQHLKEVDPDYRRFMQIFFHSGSRKTELVRLKVADVNLDKQFFKLLIKKGSQQREELRAIKNIALDFWNEQLKGSSPGDYIFSSNFKPGRRKTTPKHMSNRWREYVKEGLGIDIDFYSLKHLNLDETSDILDAEAAAKMAGHTSTVITLKHYLINEEERKMEKLRRVNNDFA
ncbi:MAG TPA: tyrosine-type recombinase/integrase [Hanamia sp.]|nr:tyrosine-type recombinase/integrase [Hanamia sp.]